VNELCLSDNWDLLYLATDGRYAARDPTLDDIAELGSLRAQLNLPRFWRKLRTHDVSRRGSGLLVKDADYAIYDLR